MSGRNGMTSYLPVLLELEELSDLALLSAKPKPTPFLALPPIPALEELDE